MAGSSMKDIKSRIKSIKNTRQITKAMQLVASSKIRRAKERMEIAKPYFNSFSDVISGVSASCSKKDSAFFEERDVKTVCHCVIAGDRGLAGGYNSNIFKHVKAGLGSSDVIILPIGRKTADFFKKEYSILTDAYAAAADISIGNCFEIGEILTEKFLDKEFDELYVTFTEYKSVLKQEVATVKLFPLCENKSSSRRQMSFEPSAGATLKQIIPSYIASVLYNAVAQSYVSELTARQNAMDTATSNADDMLSDLQLQYNRARQAGITQEITEIVAGANS